MRLRKSTRENFAALCRAFPLAVPVRLFSDGEFGDESTTRGYTKLLGGDGNPRFVIRVCAGMQEILETETLIHEYAHAMAWLYPGSQEDAVWAIAYSECYKEILGDH